MTLDTITNLGFPIALCVYLLISDTKINKLLITRIEKLEKYQSEVLQGLVESNTQALHRLERRLAKRPCLMEDEEDE